MDSLHAYLVKGQRLSELPDCYIPIRERQSSAPDSPNARDCIPVNHSNQGQRALIFGQVCPQKNSA